MAVYLDEKFTNLSSVGLVPNYPAKPEIEHKENKKPSTDYVKQYVVPLSLIAGGGILLYLGLKGPNKDRIFNKAIDSKIKEMKGYLSEFKTFVSSTVAKSFKGADNYVDVYRANYNYNVVPELSQIRVCKDAKDLLKLHKDAFNRIANTYSAENNRQGATVFDRFLVSMGEESRELSAIFWKERCNQGMKCEDLTHFIFNDYNNLENISASQGKLSARKYLTYLDMDNFRHQALKDVLNVKSKDMAQAITESRTAYDKAKKDVIEATFESARRILHLPESFKPNYDKVCNLSKFEKLSPAELKPQELPAEIKDIFEGNPVWQTVISKDFSEISNVDIERLFATLTPDNNIRDIRMMIDNLRIHNEVDKAFGKSNESIYKNLIAKIEFLSVKLQQTGENKLMKLCSEDYFALKPEVLKYKFYLLNNIVRQLGFPTIAKMEEYYLRNNKEFIKMPIRNYLPLIKEHPELYFS